MSTPTKRRKKNNYQSSPQPVRSLDFFFGKQKKEQDSRAKAEPDIKDSVSAESESLPLEKDPNGSFTDEELARQLQDEWNEQDREAQAKEDNPSYINPGKKSPHLEKLSDLPSGQVKSHASEVSAAVKEHHEPGTKAVLSLQSATTLEDNITSTIPFDENPLTFDPSKYLSDLKKYWVAEGGDASYALLTRCFILVNSTQSRIKIVDTLVNVIRTIIEGDPDSLLPMV